VDVGDPTTGFAPAYAEPSNRKLYFHRAITGNSEDGWTLAVRMRLSPQAVDPNVKMDAGYNGEDLTDLPMVGVHDGGEGTVGFSINDAGKLVVLSDGVDHEIDIGNPRQWVTIWMSATERGGTPEGRYDLKLYVNGAAAPALTLAAAQAPLSEITGSPDDWICLGSGRTLAERASRSTTWPTRPEPGIPASPRAVRAASPVGSRGSPVGRRSTSTGRSPLRRPTMGST